MVSRSRSTAVICAIFVAAVAGALACAEINTDPKLVASIALDTLPYPSIVAHDSMRDSLGIARPIRGTVYNIQGTALESAQVRFGSPDSGATVDSVTGYVTGDTARATPIRLIAIAGTLQSAPDTIYVVPAPDTVSAVNATDSLLYSITDTTVNISNPLQVQLGQKIPGSAIAGSTIPVRSFLVSYQMTYPTDTVLARLVTPDGLRRTNVDTTTAAGSAGLRVRIRTLSLTSATDSVVVIANVRYRGVSVPGAPIRFVLYVKPKT
jgi:hypothetical protein